MCCRYKAWVSKALDPFHVAKEELGQWPSLNKMLAANKLPSKSADGTQAIEFVQRSQWDALEKYCMDDTRLTHRLIHLERIKIPAAAGGGGMHQQPYLHLEPSSAAAEGGGCMRLVLKFEDTAGSHSRVGFSSSGMAGEGRRIVLTERRKKRRSSSPPSARGEICEKK